jgi:sarcosine oxidase subunit beta
MTRMAYDVIVIGGGSVGVPGALAMARDGLSVLVIDRFASPGQGSNKTAIGGIRATHSDPAKIRLCLRSLEIAKTWHEAHGDDIEWTTGGYSFVAYTPREEKILKELLVVQKKYGLDIEWHGPRELLRRIPALRHDGLLGGTFSPGDGHCSPLLFGHAMYEQAKAKGAGFRFGETITGIQVVAGRVRGVVTDKGAYEAPIVVNVAGPWASEIGHLVGVEHPVRPDSHEGGITEPVERFLDPMVVDIRPAPGSANYYFFQLATGQIVFCITPSPSLWGFDRRETSAFLPMVAKRMVDLMPCLTNLRVRRTWRGLYPMTPDGSPLVGWSSDVSGYLVAIGMCGQGFMLGPGLGELLSRLVRAEAKPEDEEILSILSPSRAFAGQEALK